MIWLPLAGLLLMIAGVLMVMGDVNLSASLWVMVAGVAVVAFGLATLLPNARCAG